MVEIHQQKKLVTSLIFILNFQKKNVYYDFKYQIQKNLKNHYVEFVYVFNVGIIIINFKRLLIRSNFFSLKLVISNCWNLFFVHIFS